QGGAWAAPAVIVPALVALIAENYRGAQQATAIGALGSARAISGVSAFFIGGSLGTLVGWRPVFVIVLALAVLVFLFSFRLRADRGDPGIRIDLVAAVLIGVDRKSTRLNSSHVSISYAVLCLKDKKLTSAVGADL